MHSSLIQRLRQEKEPEGHQGCVNSISWNSKGSLLISGSDDTRINVWSYPGLTLLHSIETSHSGNIFCTKFIPETSDELVASGAGDAEVRIFNLSRLSGVVADGNAITPSALFQCHTRRVEKLAVEDGNPIVIWSASEDGTLRQHDLREGNSCPLPGLLSKNVEMFWPLTDPPKGVLVLKSYDISSTKPHLILVGGSDAFAHLYDRRMLPPLTSCRTRMAPPPCVNYFCPMHLSERGRSTLHLTHVTFNPNGEEVLLRYSGGHVHLFDVDPVKESEMIAIEMKEEKAMLLIAVGSGTGTAIAECCMCGDHGLSDELVPCGSCNFRFQHRYCSSQYPDAESYDTCNWCLSARNNNNSPKEKHGRTSSQELLNSGSSSTRKRKSAKRLDGPAKKQNSPRMPPRRRVVKEGVTPMKYVLRNRAKRYKLLDEVSI